MLRSWICTCVGRDRSGIGRICCIGRTEYTAVRCESTCVDRTDPRTWLTSHKGYTSGFLLTVGEGVRSEGSPRGTAVVTLTALEGLFPSVCFYVFNKDGFSCKCLVTGVALEWSFSGMSQDVSLQNNVLSESFSTGVTDVPFLSCVYQSVSCQGAGAGKNFVTCCTLHRFVGS